ncbi:hypothetical protein BUE76_06555 [Cnuella takakiae]|nr:hypothetical protein BUE76_06555 [Cnuella takakiae]
MIQISETIGRFHPVLVHLPIGIMVIAVAMHWLSENPRYAISEQVLRLLYGAGIGGALLALITGFLLSNHGEYEDGTLALHMWLAIFTATLSLLVFARLVQRKSDARWLALLLAAMILCTGHWGGVLSHGADYLNRSGKKNQQGAAQKELQNTDSDPLLVKNIQP